MFRWKIEIKNYLIRRTLWTKAKLESRKLKATLSRVFIKKFHKFQSIFGVLSNYVDKSSNMLLFSVLIAWGLLLVWRLLCNGDDKKYQETVSTSNIKRDTSAHLMRSTLTRGDRLLEIVVNFPAETNIAEKLQQPILEYFRNQSIELQF